MKALKRTFIRLTFILPKSIFMLKYFSTFIIILLYYFQKLTEQTIIKSRTIKPKFPTRQSSEIWKLRIGDLD